MIVYKVLTDLGDLIRNGLNPGTGEVCLMRQGTWTRQYYTKEDYIIGFIKRV